MVKERLSDIDRAKGVGIFLVVLGHLVFKPDSLKYGIEFYKTLNRVIYLFHMPFFMFICGIVMYYTYKPITSLNDYYIYIKKKFVRLIPAYILFSIIIFAGKLNLKSILHIDNQVNSNTLIEFANIFMNPMHSFSKFLWFIYILFIFYAIVPILLELTKHRLLILLFFSLALHFVPGVEWFGIHLIFEYLFFFMLGVSAIKYYKDYTFFIDKYWYYFFIAFILFFFIMFQVELRWVDKKLIMGFLSIPALHGLIRIKTNANWEILQVWGAYTFPIYLMNTLFIGIIKGVFLLWVDWNGITLIFMLPFMLFGGIYLPVYMKKYIISHVSFLNKIIV